MSVLVSNRKSMYLCGKPTLSGRPCTHPVQYPGGPCAARRLHARHTALSGSALPGWAWHMDTDGSSQPPLPGQVCSGGVYRDQDWSGRCLDGCIFDGALLQDVDLSGCSAIATSWEAATLVRVKMAGVDWGEEGGPRGATLVDCAP